MLKIINFMIISSSLFALKLTKAEVKNGKEVARDEAHLEQSSNCIIGD